MNVFLQMKRRGKKAVGYLKKIKRGILQRKRYLTFYEKEPVDSGCVLLESQHGKALDGNVYAVLQELCTAEVYAGLRLFVSAEAGKRRTFQELLKKQGLTRVTVVTHGSLRYFRLLATAGYLVNDNTFLYCFIKRPEQIYLNTWHGTPLKTLGRSSKSEYWSIGNAQKTFLDADYVLYPNEFTMQHMVEDYMVGNIGKFTPLLGGYPRNTVFFDRKAGESLRRRYVPEGRTAYAYLPTWRGTIGNVSDQEQDARLSAYFKELDEKLADDILIYVKMHTVSASHISLEGYRHILPFPKEETYAFLNAVDGLITDYSSVFFDFAVSRKKIVLFPYDLAEYEAERGFYFPLSELPFPQVYDTDALSAELSRKKDYDDTDFLQSFCAYDSPDATKRLCEHVFLNRKTVKEVPLPDNGKENVLMYCGDLALNGVTVSLQNLLANIDVTARNYILLVKTSDIRRNAFRLRELPEGVTYLGFSNCMSLNIVDTIRFKLFTKKKPVGTYEKMRPVLERLARQDYERIGSRACIDTVIHFNGYTNHITLVLGQFPCRRVIYAHSDMDAELNTRISMKREILCWAYRTYDAVAVVTEDLIPTTQKVAGYLPECGHEPQIQVVKNVINYQRIRTLGAQDFETDEQTELSLPMERLQEILASDALKLITIGRFSPEKGHMRLMEQFAGLLPEHPDTYLILLGSRGVLYRETLEYADRLGLGEHLIIIHYLSNPYALLRQCQYFVFSSFYEGFGLVLAEADILGVPCVSTDIVGTGRFMRRYGGRLVENSDQGVREALRMCMEREFHSLLKVDYEQYNREAVEAFLEVSSTEKKETGDEEVFGVPEE